MLQIQYICFVLDCKRFDLYTCIRTAFNVKNCIFHFKVACQTIMDRLEPYCNANPKGSWDSWVSYENIEV